jgi:hypothetical protein
MKKDLSGFMNRKSALEAKVLVSQARPSPPLPVLFGSNPVPPATYQQDVVSLGFLVGDSEHEIRLTLDSRRRDPAYQNKDLRPLYVAVGSCNETDTEVFELLFTADQYDYCQEQARAAGLDFWEWIMRRCETKFNHSEGNQSGS